MLKRDERFKSLKLSVMGHSWGAFSTMNIAALHPEVTHVVAMSGFVSVPLMIQSSFTGLLSPYRKAVLELEEKSNPVFSKYNSAQSLRSSGVKALLIYSDNDHICKAVHRQTLIKELADVDTVKFIITKNKFHNPNYTEDAAKYVVKFGEARKHLVKSKKLNEEKTQQFLSSFDWDRMTAQDAAVWQKIYEHLDS